MSYGLYYDVDDVALDRLGITDLPATLFVDASGKILAVHHGVLTKSDLESETRQGLLRPARAVPVRA